MEADAQEGRQEEARDGAGRGQAPATEPPPPAGKQFIRGDADANGTIAITDAVRILNFLFIGEAPPPCHSSARRARSS